MSGQAGAPARAYDISYPVALDLERPPAFQRAHVLLRVALLVVIGWIGHPLGLLWVGIPVVAAILVSQKGGQRYLDENGPTVIRVLNWILDVTAYAALLTDRLPGPGRHPVRFEVVRSGTPTPTSALLRILYAIPSLLVFAFLMFVGSIVWVVALVSVLVNERYPVGMWRFLRALLRWEACLFAYLASLVDPYPPFTLETGRSALIFITKRLGRACPSCSFPLSDRPRRPGAPRPTSWRRSDA